MPTRNPVARVADAARASATVPSSKRFIVMPGTGFDPNATLAARVDAAAGRSPRRLSEPPRPNAAANGHSVHAAYRRATKAVPATGLAVVDSSPVDGALLVRAPGHTAASLQEQLPGSVVAPEKFYVLERALGKPWLLRLPRPQVTARTGAAAPTRTAVSSRHAFRVHVRDDHGRDLPDVTLTALIGRQAITGTTNKTGRARLAIHERFRTITRLYADPLHSAWSVFVDNVPISGATYTLTAPSLALSAKDARNAIYGRASAGSGRGVKVAVVDGGVGPHADLPIAFGTNTTTEEDTSLFEDGPEGHGTHVAGVIAARTAGPRRGEAPAVTLHAFRVFSASSPYASNFAIQKAILEAATMGCHLVNLSLGGGGDDIALRSAIDAAWELGCVCLAAAGNDGEGQVDFPASHEKVLAVSAIGLTGTWPEGTYYGEEVSRVTGTPLAGATPFRARFSNHGQGIALASPGLAIVSTIPRDRWGVMSGTSMATPVATGVLARLIEREGLHRMAPHRQRSEAIVKLARTRAVDLGLPLHTQGHGLLR